MKGHFYVFFGMAEKFASFLIIKIVNLTIFLCNENIINGIFGAQAPNIRAVIQMRLNMTIV